MQYHLIPAEQEKCYLNAWGGEGGGVNNKNFLVLNSRKQIYYT